ncbi:hypothetical protein CDAR_367421 [Caerostris darwini]|uniref:Uncharacterized protein n=1 Tax=Caerostris darwini TaxID=1538125 RepID=A0AAV4SF37_9ARAC|nr:hypothetical protein CDAR_367421 [Caerostris darwini]
MFKNHLPSRSATANSSRQPVREFQHQLHYHQTNLQETAVVPRFVAENKVQTYSEAKKCCCKFASKDSKLHNDQKFLFGFWKANGIRNKFKEIKEFVLDHELFLFLIHATHLTVGQFLVNGFIFVCPIMLYMEADDDEGNKPFQVHSEVPSELASPKSPETLLNLSDEERRAEFHTLL